MRSTFLNRCTWFDNSRENNTVTLARNNNIPEIQRYEWEDSYLYSIIKRDIIRRSSKRPLGDNCPMLYAMKNCDNLITRKDVISELYRYVSESIYNYFGNECDFDLIIPMPSSCSIPLDISKIIHKLYNINIFDVNNYIVKKERSEIIQSISLSRTIPDSSKQIILTALSRDKEKLSIKNVKVKDRHYLFPIFKVLGDVDIFDNYSPTNILLIDDIFTSGLTLSSVKSLLKTFYPSAKVSALTLFSPLSKTLK